MTPQEATRFAELLREDEERQRAALFPATSEQAPVALPLPAVPAADVDVAVEPELNMYDDLLGSTPGITETQILDDYNTRLNKLLEQQSLDVQASPELLAKQRQDLEDKYLRQSVDVSGANVGRAFRSDLLLDIDEGFILGEDGQPRKASLGELFTNAYQRQVVARGPEFERQVVRLRNEHAAEIQEHLKDGLTYEEALEKVRPLGEWMTSSLNFDTRSIDETTSMFVLRSILGTLETAVGEAIDYLPLTYEVTPDGKMQYPDDIADNIARMAGEVADYDLVDTPFGPVDMRNMSDLAFSAITLAPRAVIAGAESVIGVDDLADSAYDTLGSGVGWAPYYAIRATQKLPEMIPQPFVAIDRDAPTPLDEAGKRTAAATGSFIGDVLMGVARGRMYTDELLSMPSYRERLGEDYKLALAPALLAGIATPITPLGMIGKSAKVLGKSGSYIGRTLSNAATGAEPAAWGRAYAQHRQLVDLVENAGGSAKDVPSVKQILFSQGEVVDEMAAKMAVELTTPTAMKQASDLSPEALKGLAQQSKSGEHILRRAEEVGLDQAYWDWRIGLEVKNFGDTLARMGDAAQEDLLKNLLSFVEQAAGPEAVQWFRASSVYQPVLKAAATDDVVQTVANWKGAARRAGSAQLNTGSTRLRQVLRVLDDVTDGKDLTEIATRSLLAPYLTRTRGVGELLPALKVVDDAARNSMEVASSLSRMARLAVTDVVRPFAPRNMQMVTQRTMVPRAVNTAQVKSQVGEVERMLLQTEFVKVGKENMVKVLGEQPKREVLRQLLRELLPGVGRDGSWLARSPLYKSLDDSLAEGKPLTLQEYSVLADTAREAGYRQILGRKVEAPAFAGREFDLANRPTMVVDGERIARLGQATDLFRPLLESTFALLEGTRRFVAPAIPAAEAATTNAAAARGFVAAKLNKPVELLQQWLRGSNPNMPAVMRAADDEYANMLGVLARQFDEEASALTRAARDAGSETPGPDAARQLVKRRWEAIGKSSDDQFEAEVNRMMREHLQARARNPKVNMPSRAELAWRVVYNSGQAREVNIGRRLRTISAMGPAERELMYKSAKLMMRRGAHRQQMRNILTDFFGNYSRVLSRAGDAKVQDRIVEYLDAVLDQAILPKEARPLQRAIAAKRKAINKLDGEGSESRQLIAEVFEMMDELATVSIISPTVEGLQEVFETVRTLVPQLKDRGAARFGLTGFKDAVFETTMSWAKSYDQQVAAQKIYSQVADTHPELVVELAPIVGVKGWAQSAEARVYTPVDTVGKVLDSLYAAAASKASTEDALRLDKLYEAAQTRLSKPGLVSGTGQRPPRPLYHDDPALPKLLQRKMRMAEKRAAEAQARFLQVTEELATVVGGARYTPAPGKLTALPPKPGQLAREIGPEGIERARVELRSIQVELRGAIRERDKIKQSLAAARKRSPKSDEVAILAEDVAVAIAEVKRLRQVDREINRAISEGAKGIKQAQTKVDRAAKGVSKLQATQAKAKAAKSARETELEEVQALAKKYIADNPVISRDAVGVDSILAYVDVRMNGLEAADLAKVALEALEAMKSSGSLVPTASTVKSLAGATQSGGALTVLSDVARSIQAMARMSPRGEPIHDAFVAFVKTLEESNLTRPQIADLITNPVRTRVDEAINQYVYDQVAQSLRGYGVSTAVNKTAITDITNGLARIPGRELQMLPDMAGMGGAVEAMVTSARNGRLLSTLQNLQKRNLLSGIEREEAGLGVAFTRFGVDVAATTLALSRQLTSYGLLAGGIVAGMAGIPIPLPFISRYIGLNAFSAPLMMVGTVGARRTVAALSEAPGVVGDVLRKVRLPFKRGNVDVVSPRLPDDVRYVDAYGKSWTVRESEALFQEWNWYMSRASVDQSADLMLTLQRSMRVQVGKEGLENLPWYRLAQQHMFSPRRTSVGMRLATEMDSVFRKSTFMSAVRDGMPPQQAAELARASVLDYGAVPQFVKESVNRYVLFATFKMASYAEVMKALARGSDDFLRVMRLQYRMHQAANTWAAGEDYDRARMFMFTGETFDGVPSIIAGPQEVFSSTFTEMIQIVGFLSALSPFTEDAGDVGRRVSETIQEQNIMPLAQMAATIVAPPARASKRLVPDVWVVRMEHAGYMDQFREMFDIKPVTRPVFGGRDRRRPGTPTFGPTAVQYEFSPKGYKKWVNAQLFATQLTLKRQTEDVTKAGIAAGYGPAGYDPKYRGAVSFLPYFMGLATGLKGRTNQNVYDMAYRTTVFQNK